MNNNNNTPAMVSTIANMTYSTIVSSGQKAFLATVPKALQPIYTKAQLWYQWATAGYVPTFHNMANGVLQTNIGVSITDNIARVLGGNLLISTADEKLKNWFTEENLNSVINKAIKFAVKGGTSLVKLNRIDDEVFGEAYRIDNFVASADRKGNVSDAKVYVDYIEDGKPGRMSGYWLIEHRYFSHGKGKIKFYISKSNLTTSGATEGMYTTYENCPGVVKEWVINHGITLDKESDCEFADGSLGLFLLKVRDLGIDANSPYGESFVNPILSDLYEYEYNESNKVVDMYSGRARVMVGEQFVNNGMGPVGGLDNYLLFKVPNNSMDAGKPEALQFDYRVGDHKETKEEILESMASKLGLSATTIGSHLKSEGMKTATEITAENDMTANFAASIRREFIIPFVKRIINSIFTSAKYNLSFPTSGFTSINVRMNQAKDIYASGLATIAQALRIIYPDMDDETINKMAEEVSSEKKENDAEWLKADI